MKQFQSTQLTLCLLQDEQGKFYCQIQVKRPDVPNDKGVWYGDECETPREAVYASLCGLAEHNNVTACLHLEGKEHQVQATPKPHIYRQNGIWQCEKALQTIDAGNFIAKIEAPFRELNIQSIQLVERLNKNV